MTILIYTDASTREGYSCWAFKTPFSDVRTGIVQSANSAAIETLAVVEALQSLPYIYEDIMIVSDFLGVVKTIMNKTNHAPRSGVLTEYHHYRTILLHYCSLYAIDALWVASKCPNQHHQDVDQASKIILLEYLKNVK